MSKLSTQTVLDVRHWNDSLFSFKVTRDAGLRFENIESFVPVIFIMLLSKNKTK